MELIDANKLRKYCLIDNIPFIIACEPLSIGNPGFLF